MVLYIGLAGTPLAGKGIIRTILSHRYGAYGFSLSDMLREEADRRGVEKTRQALTDIADELRLKKGHGVLAEMALNKIMNLSDDFDVVIIDSIRNPGEVEMLRTALKRHFFLIFIDAPAEQRYKRSIERKREGESSHTFEEFIAKDKEEMEGRKDRLIQDERGHHGDMIDYGVNLGACMVKANLVLINDGTLADLEKKVFSAVEQRVQLLKEYSEDDEEEDDEEVNDN